MNVGEDGRIGLRAIVTPAGPGGEAFLALRDVSVRFGGAVVVHRHGVLVVALGHLLVVGKSGLGALQWMERVAHGEMTGG